MDRYQIRPAIKKDIPAIQSLYLQEEEYHRERYPQYFREMAEVIAEKELEKEITEPDSLYLVTLKEKKVIGFIYLKKTLFSKDPPFKPVEYISIEDCVVEEQYRRQGVATSLIKAADSWAKQMGIKRMQLQVWANNEAAIRLYRKIGFKDMIIRMELEVRRNPIRERKQHNMSL